MDCRFILPLPFFDHFSAAYPTTSWFLISVLSRGLLINVKWEMGRIELPVVQCGNYYPLLIGFIG